MSAMEFDQWVEWRVTGDPGHGYPPYDYVWSERQGPDREDPEGAARRFAAAMTDWVDGPHLHRRVVREWAWRRVVDRVRPHGGRWPDPGPDALCASCAQPRHRHGGPKQMGACPDESGLYGRRFQLRDEDKQGRVSP